MGGRAAVWNEAQMLKRAAKGAARRLGVFPLTRNLYRRLDPRVRRARRRDLAFFKSLVGRNDLVFDIGANLGQKSEIFLACGARVVALEPNPLCAPTLRFEFARNDGFRLIEKAVGAEAGRARLNFVGAESTASLRGDWKWLTEGGKLKARNVEVEVTTLDALIAEFGPPAYCKIDVEGFELEVLRGLTQTIPLLSFEYHGEELDRLAACLERLASLSPIAVNVIEMNGAGFIMAEWRTHGEALAEARAGALPPVGDVFVRMRRASIARPADRA